MEDSQERKRKKEKSDEYYKERKSRRHSSKSPERHRDRDRDSVRDASRKRRRSRSPKRDERRNEGKMEAPRKSKTDDMLNTRTGGAYIPPARLRMMQAQITDKASVAYQRLAWEALKKSIHGHINKINVGNIGIIIKELLKENIVRGRGLLCRSVIQAQAASPTFTNVYAALVAAVNSRFPNIGELLLKRLVIQFKRGFKRNDKALCISSASFVAHLVNQRVAHEILALELLTLLVETPSDDSVEVAIAFLKECGQKLTEVSSKGVNAIFEMLRNILHEGQLDKRVQYMIEVMFQVWKDGFKDHPSVIEELELVPEEEQFTHLLMLDEATDAQDILNVFKFDEKYEDNEQKYKTLSKEILGSDAESGEEEDGSAESGSDESDDEEDEQKPVTIIDNTETNLVALRRTIYLTINSSLDFEECAHKLMKMQLKPGQEIELCHMFLDCCAEQRTYEKFYGLLAQRFCNINRIYVGPFEEIFKDSYATAHRLDTNRLRNISKFFAHLLFTDSISWEALDCVKLNEEDTTSSSRIYIKILFQELAEYMGLKKLNDRLRDQTLQEAFLGIFPRDNPKNTRFSINFFTSIGLGGLTDDLREHLKQMPKNVPVPAEIKVHSDSSSDSSSSSSSSSSDSSSSDSEEDTENGKNKTKKKGSNAPKSNNPDRNSNKEERWGHDGYFERYGRDEQRSSREGRSKQEEFARPKDVSKRTMDTQRSSNFDIKQKNSSEKGKTQQKRKECANKKEMNDFDVRSRSDSEQGVKEHTPTYDSYWNSTSRKKGNDFSKDRDDEYRHRDQNRRADKDLDKDNYKESEERSEKEQNVNRRDKYEKRNHQKSIVNTSSNEQRKFDVGNMKSSIKRDKNQEKVLETSSRNTSRPENSSHVDQDIIADKGFHKEKGKTDKNDSYNRQYKHKRGVQLAQDKESSDDSEDDSRNKKTYGKHNLKPMGDSDDSKSGGTPEEDSDSRNKRDKYVKNSQEKKKDEPKIGRYWDSYDTEKSRDSQGQSRHKRVIKSRR
ncbi:pre-mRNA-splicing factor CWC22 homolog [Pieris brassicae]|uniref:pre-mRNA-splicing factor CWC22 homolog n=1 Tax=Pieris brassicae TaxID=7116 RepID=UPI001E65F050|nr:pre-mRNA-splicing factor CWC22 homolog [Pieris brassicae]